MNKTDVRTDEELVAKYKGGDPEAMDLLLNRYKSFVRAQSRMRFLIGGDEEDLIQEGMIGLYKAVRDYDESRGASFKTFAALCISRQMARAIESSGREKNRPLNSSVSLTDEEWENQMKDETNSPESIVLNQESGNELLKKIKKSLSPMEQSVLDLYLTGADYREIAEKIRKSPKSIDNTLQRIRKKTIKNFPNSYHK